MGQMPLMQPGHLIRLDAMWNLTGMAKCRAKIIKVTTLCRGT